MFALRHKETGKLLTYTFVSNGDADFCADVSVELGLCEHDPVWTTTYEGEAERALETTNAWYNEFRHSFKWDELEVVKVDLVVVS